MNARGLGWLSPVRWKRRFLLAHAGLVVFSAAAFFWIVGRPPPASIDPALWNLAYFHGMQWSGPAYITAGFAAAWAGWREAVPRRIGTVVLLAVLALSLLAEWVGTTTGLPFGPYSYGSRLGPLLFGEVPVVIPLSWFLMLYASLGVAARLRLSSWATAATATAGLVAWDVLMDPAMSAAFPFWSWHVEGAFYGMPLVNWVGWFLTGLVLSGVAVGMARPHWRALADQRTPVLLYVLNGLLPLALAIQAGLWGAVAAGGGAMGLYLALPFLADRWRRGGGRTARSGDDAGRGRRFGPAEAVREWLRGRVRDRDFRLRAGRFPLTRPAVVRSSGRLFRWTTGFAATQAVRALLETGVLDALSDSPRTPDEVSRSRELPQGSVERLLRAGRSLGLLHERSSGWELTVDGAALAAHEPLRAMITHHALLYRDLSDPSALLRSEGEGAELRRLWGYGGGSDRAELEEEDVEAYGRLMRRTARMAADAVTGGYDLGRHRRLLDVAGGEGAFLAHLAERRPGLELALFELPPVARRARRRLEGQGLGDRVRVDEGDLFLDPLPEGADLITLQRVLLDWSDREAVRILNRVRAALPDGGRVLAAEPILDAPGMPPEAGPYFEMYFLAMGGGRARRTGELAELFREAGLRRVRFPTSPVPVEAGLVLAER